MSASPEPYRISRTGVLVPVADTLDPHDAMRDPRGIVWCWEKPIRSATYVVGVDPSVGITGWTRELRTADDFAVDNGAIEVIRVAGSGRPDVQVAEFAAPVDAEDLADYVNALGTLYAGASDLEQALVIVEAYPGPGLLTIQRLAHSYAYSNHFIWKYLDTLTPSATATPKPGFYASRESVKALWMRTSRHIHRGGLTVRSPALRDEMKNCSMDAERMVGYGVFGCHDDRIRAMQLAIWAAHDWSLQVDVTEPSKVAEGEREPSWQASDISADRLLEAWEERFRQIQEGYE